MEYNGIDVSELQGNINWARVAQNGINFAMVRATYDSSGMDSQFEKNITIPKIMIPSSDLTPDKINYGKVNYEKIEVYYTYAY